MTVCYRFVLIRIQIKRFILKIAYKIDRYLEDYVTVLSEEKNLHAQIIEQC